MKDEHCELVDQAGCKECKNNLAETKNETGWYVPKGEQQCKQCPKYCKLCETDPYDKTGEPMCTACLDGHLLEEKENQGEDDTEKRYRCVEKDDKCEETEMGYCTKCAEGNFISYAKCISCDKSCASCQYNDRCINCAPGYYLPPDVKQDTQLCRPISEINMTCGSDGGGTSSIQGCVNCNKGFYKNDTNGDYNCSECSLINENWAECKVDGNEVVCTECTDLNHETRYYDSDTKECVSCSTIKHCKLCKSGGCEKCEDGYSPDGPRRKCTKTNWGAIIGGILAFIVILIILIGIIVALIWWRRSKFVKKEVAAIKPFHVDSDLELLLLGADNERFPLKTNKWSLAFGLEKAKALLDSPYVEEVQLANMSKKVYYFEFHFTKS